MGVRFRNGVDRLPAISGWVRPYLYCDGRGAVLRRSVATYAKMPFICCAKEEAYAIRLSFDCAKWFGFD